MRRSIRKLTFILAIAAAPCLMWVAPASAQKAPSADAQRAEFAAAQKLFDAGEHAAALPKFEALVSATGSPNARLYVARSLRALGRDVEAFDAMSQTVREANERAQTEPKYVQTRDSAAAELALLAPRVGHLVIALSEAREGATVTLNGLPVTPAQLGAPITVAPGMQTVEISVPGGPSMRRAVEVGGGETKAVALTPPRAEQESTGAPRGSVDPDTEQESTGGGLRIVGIVAGVLGAGSLAAFAVTGVMSDAEFSTLEEECGNARCEDPDFADTIDKGKTLETVANVTLVAGAVLAAAAIPLIIFGGPSDAAPTATVTYAPGGGFVSFSGRF